MAGGEQERVGLRGMPRDGRDGARRGEGGDAGTRAERGGSDRGRTGGWRAGRGTRRRGRSGRLAMAAIPGLALAGWLVGGEAWAHNEPLPLPPEGDYWIRWHQPHNVVPIADWEIEVTPQRNPRNVFVTSARAFSDPSCWALDVPVAEPANVRIRAVAGRQVSAWSRYTAVPEPGVALGLAVGGVGLAASARRRGARRQRGSR